MAEDKLVSETIDISDITMVELRDFGSILIKQGAEESLTIQAPPDLLAKIRSEVKNNKLLLGIGRDWMERVFSGYDFIRQRKVKYSLQLKSLEDIAVSGMYDVTCSNLDCKQLKVKSSGASTIKIENLTTEELIVGASGRGEFFYAGQAEKQSIRCSGSCEYRAAGLQTSETSISISGHSRAEVWVEKSLAVSISGFGTVSYRGQPSISQSISGLGEIKRMDAE